MHGRALLVLAVVVIALGAFIWFVERELPSSEERAERANQLLQLELDDIDGLVLERVGARIELRRFGPAPEAGVETAPAESRWRLLEPLQAPADDSQVENLLRSVSELKKHRTLTDMARADAGLEPPGATLRLFAGEQETALELGVGVPASSTMLVGVASHPEIYVVDDVLSAELERPAEDWRNRRLFPARRGEVVRLALSGAAGELVLARREDDYWLESPVVDLAAEELVDRLVDELLRLEAERFVEAPTEPGAELGLGSAGRIEVGVAGERPPFVLEIGAAVGEGRVYVRAGELVVTTAADFSQALTRDASGWRSRRLSALPVYSVERLDITGAGEPLELVRRDGDWHRGDTTVGFGAINDLLYALDEARATGFLAVGEATGAPSDLTFSYAGRDGAAQVIRLLAPRSEGIPVEVSGRPSLLLLAAEAGAELVTKLDAVRTAEPLAADSESPAPPE